MSDFWIAVVIATVAWYLAFLVFRHDCNLYVPFLTCARERTALLRADGDQWYLDRHDELVAWAEKAAWPDRVAEAIAAIPEEHVRELFPGRYTQPDLDTPFVALPCSTDAHTWEYEKLPSGAKKATCHACDQVIEEAAPVQVASRISTGGAPPCIIGLEHDWVVERQHAADGFQRVFRHCHLCQRGYVEMVIDAPPRASVATPAQQLRALRTEKVKAISALVESFQRQELSYRDLVKSIQEVDRRLVAEEQREQIAAAIAVPLPVIAEGEPSRKDYVGALGVPPDRSARLT